MLIQLEAIIEAPLQDYLAFVFVSNPLAGVSPFVENMFPLFVREDHERFITFMKTYYEWMESQNNVLNDAKKLRDYQDIDYTKEPYVERFFREFLTNFPRNAPVDKQILLKNIKDFYRSRGTERSYEMFFRVLYNINAEFYYPRQDILKVSDGKWIQKKSLRVFASTGDAYELRSKKIKGVKSNSSAYVENVFVVSEGIFSGFELVLNRSSITGDFLPEELVTTEDGLITARISAIPNTITITNPGQNYVVGETFNVDVVGSGAVVEVESVDSTTGAITSIKIQDYGIGYQKSLPLINFSLEKQGSPEFATISIDFGALAVHEGYYLNEDGQISTLKYLHDGNFYQAFSYVVFVDASLNEYRELLERILHPAGFKLFGGFRTQKLVDAKVHLAKGSVRSFINITSSGATALNAGVKLAQSSSSISLINAPSSQALGPTNYSIHINRFRYKPVSKYNANEEILAIPNYFGVYSDLAQQKAITPISSFDALGFKMSDVDAARRKGTKILPDAVVITENDLIGITP